jgi:hypothetical protein
MEDTGGSVGVLDRESVGEVDEPPTTVESVPIFETVLTRQIRYIAATCSLAAGLIHVLAMIDHRSEPTLSRAFLAVAVFQFVWGVLLLAGARSVIVYGTGAVVAAASIGVWVFSRTKGISWFPGLDHVEALGWRDVVTQFFQLLVVAGTAILMLPASVHKPAGKRIEVAPIAIFVLLTVLTLAVLYGATHGVTEHTH